MKIRSKSIFKLRQIPIVVEFFDKYPLYTNKQLNFLRFKQIWCIKEANGHKTPEGLAKIKAIKASMNLGRLSSNLTN
jgi:hypothetical protein